MKTNVVIWGDAGKEFHVFQTYYRGIEKYQVVAFMSELSSNRYPETLAGEQYPHGIPIVADDLSDVIKNYYAEELVFARLGIHYEEMSLIEKQTRLCGVDFKLPEVARAMLPSRKYVIAVSSVAPGYNKSDDIAQIAEILQTMGKITKILCYPMDMSLVEDYRVANTIEESNESPESLILWQCPQNDLPYLRPNLHIVLADSATLLEDYWSYPGRINLEIAQVILLKNSQNIDDRVQQLITKLNPQAIVIQHDDMEELEKILKGNLQV